MTLDESFPCIFILLRNKEKGTYDSMIENLISAIGTGLKPEIIMLDFEQGAIKAFKKYFITAQIKGCFFI